MSKQYHENVKKCVLPFLWYMKNFYARDFSNNGTKKIFLITIKNLW